MTDPKCLFKLHKKGNLQNVLTGGGGGFSHNPIEGASFDIGPRLEKSKP